MAKKDTLFIILSSFHLLTLRKMVEKVERVSRIEILRHPRTTRMGTEEMIQFAPVIRGQSLMTRCTVSVDGTAGYGVIPGDSWEKAYCFAVIDAALSGGHPLAPEIEKTITQQASFLAGDYHTHDNRAINERPPMPAGFYTAIS